MSPLPCSQVFLNGTQLKFKSFKDYVEMFKSPHSMDTPSIFEKVNERWEIGVGVRFPRFLVYLVVCSFFY